MNISEAIRSAKGKRLTRRKWIETSNESIEIEPTDTGECCILYLGGAKTAPRWNPQREDLIAEDWIVSD